jgi:hypothetical protein
MILHNSAYAVANGAVNHTIIPTQALSIGLRDAPWMMRACRALVP